MSPPAYPLYSELAAWWAVLSPPETYEEEAALYLALLRQAADGPVRSLLELGSGAGHHASQLPRALDATLLDISPQMLDLSRALNPRRAHVQGDMRDARLGRTFDAVLLHDAVMYMTSEADLAAALRTAAAHARPGGAVLVVPDVVAETFEEGTVSGGGQHGDRAAQLLEWHWDPDPSDCTYQADFAFLLREGGAVRCAHESHTMGLHSRATYWRLLRAAGLEPVAAAGLLPEGEIFLARRVDPGAGAG